MDNAGKKPVWSVQPPKGMLKGDYYRIRVTWALWRR